MTNRWVLRGRLGVLFVGALVLGCRQAETRALPEFLERDPHSAALPEEAVVRHLELRLSVDFESRTLDGDATWRFVDRAGSGRLVLDTRDLEILDVELLDGAGGAESVAARLGPADALLGQALEIAVRPDTVAVRVRYRTSPEAAALQWLDPEQTGGGHWPFVFTQSQAILARSWVPCQDTPGVRFTYEAAIEAHAELTALMSADRVDRSAGPVDDPRAQATHFFRMDQPIPAYLLALAVGKLEFRSLGSRTGVWAEPSLIELASWEFADTEAMMSVAEELFGPYRWGRYDLLVLPPSFPFGGMENPKLTFATPTIVAGDRSLVALVAHELAHSWSGNLVTNATWNGFWLNEGFTVYLEHRIMEALRGKEYDEMLAALGLADVEEAIEELAERPRDTHLQLDLEGRDPDDGMTAIAYDKGYLFLRTIEETVGRARFDAFLREYFDTFAFGSMTSERFVAYLRKELVGADAELERRLRIDEWVYGPGLPANAPRIESAAFRAVDAEVARWESGVAAREIRTAGWTTHEWLRFLRSLSKPLALDRVAELDATYELTEAGNAEIVCTWLEHTIASGYSDARPRLEEFLLTVGRRKFLSPLYRALAATEEGKAWAREVYERARPSYHQVARGTIEGILGLR